MTLEQAKQFNQIILARPIVPLSNKEIGFLPGDANDKIGPYMEPLFDNLKFIKSQFGENEKKHKAILELEEGGKIVIAPLAFIRGRSLSNVFFIVDEAQNLSPHEVKTIITRAGEGTKIVLKLRKQLEEDTQVLGPVLPKIARINNFYRAQIIIKYKQSIKIDEVLKNIYQEYSEILTIAIDKNPSLL